MKITHNKLIRDRIPEIIENHNKICKISYLNDYDFSQALFNKLLEEVHELISAETKIEMINELADILEVLDAISANNKISRKEILMMKSQKAKKNGAFKEKIYLEYVEEQ